MNDFDKPVTMNQLLQVAGLVMFGYAVYQTVGGVVLFVGAFAFTIWATVRDARADQARREREDRAAEQQRVAQERAARITPHNEPVQAARATHLEWVRQCALARQDDAARVATGDPFLDIRVTHLAWIGQWASDNPNADRIAYQA